MPDKDPFVLRMQPKVAKFEQQLEDLFVDPDGLIYNVIHDKHRRPYKAEDFAPTDRYRPIWEQQGWPTIEAFTNYENTPHQTGLYLAYQAYRYQVTGDPVCLQRGGRTLEAVKCNFDIGEKVLERGYWPKPFGGLSEARRSKDMTPDNNFELVLGLSKYLDVAPPDQHAVAAEVLQGIIDFYVRHNFDHSWLLERGYRGLFDYVNTYHYHCGPAIICYLKIAADHFGPEPYQRLYQQLLNTRNELCNSLFETHVQKQQRLGDAYWTHPDITLYHNYPDYLLKDKQMGIVTIGGAWSAVGESIGYLAQHDPDRPDFFHDAAAHWFTDEIEPSYAGAGWGYLRVAYDYRSKKILLTPPEIHKQIIAESEKGKPHVGMHNNLDGKLSAGVWLLASMGLHLANPDIGAGEFTKQLLIDIEEPNLRTFADPDQGQWAEGKKHVLTQYVGPLFWLHTYYCGKYHQAW